MTKSFIIVRHGNTFRPDQTPTRVGRGTDLPLVEDQRGTAVGKYLLSKSIVLDKAYAAPLQRTMQTAQLVLDAMHSDLPIIQEKQFSEIDYGPDENKTEEEVIFRLGTDYVRTNNLVNLSNEEICRFGKSIINQWDTDGTIPNGWSVDVKSIIDSWKYFADSINDGETILLCSSNGIIRFAPYILSLPYNAFANEHEIKVATGSVSIFEFTDGKWQCEEWNSKPYKLY